jgi:D-alanine-D-alanine ligase
MTGNDSGTDRENIDRIIILLREPERKAKVLRPVGKARNIVDDLRHNLPVLLLHNMNPEWAPGDRGESEQDVATLGNALQELGHPIEVVAVEDGNLADRLKAFAPRDYIVFNWCEELPGIPHSEPEVAAVMERLGFVFTGSSHDVLALAYDKPRIKRLLDEEHIPTPPWDLFDAPEVGRWNIFPAIVKAAHEHCSIGISPESIVTSPAELENRVAFILENHRQPALVEQFIDGRELHVAAWGNGEISILPAAEIDYCDLTDIRDRLFTYEAKYFPGSLLYERIELRVPAELDPPARDELERVVLDSYRAVGCRDYGRIDVRYLSGVFYVIDVNPNPDINPLTSMTYAAAEVGYSYGKMGSRIVNFAADRHPVFR